MLSPNRKTPIMVFVCRLICACLFVGSIEISYQQLLVQSCHGGIAMKNPSAYVVIAWLLEVHWTPCDTNKRWLVHAFNLGCVHDLPTWVVKTRMGHTTGNLIGETVLPLQENGWGTCAKPPEAFDKVQELTQVERDDLEDDVLDLSRVSQHILEIDGNA